MPSLIEQNILSCITKTRMETGAEGGLKITASCIFPGSFTGFQGHFPDQSVLPAIIQLAVVRRLTEQAVQFPLTSIQYTRTKFKAMVAPEEELVVTINLDVDEKKVTGKFKITKDANRQVAGGNFVFKKQSVDPSKY